IPAADYSTLTRHDSGPGTMSPGRRPIRLACSAPHRGVALFRRRVALGGGVHGGGDLGQDLAQVVGGLEPLGLRLLVTRGRGTFPEAVQLLDLALQRVEQALDVVGLTVDALTECSHLAEIDLDHPVTRHCSLSLKALCVDEPNDCAA